MIHILSDKLEFPDPSTAEKDDLLAIGGDLSTKRLLLAYRSGIFPWFSEDDPILWYSPHKRFVLYPSKIKVSKSMEKVIRSGKFTVTVNKAFREVITNCSAMKRKGQEGTWITSDMIEAYCKLNEEGHAHSFEVWEKEKLAGGLYGVQVGPVFCGESMFSKVDNASKMALIYLCREMHYELIDCQVHTKHLQSMGAQFISRKEYEKHLQKARK